MLPCEEPLSAERCGARATSDRHPCCDLGWGVASVGRALRLAIAALDYPGDGE
jgi:hypothetical protein